MAKKANIHAVESDSEIENCPNEKHVGQSRLMSQKDMPTDGYGHDTDTAAIRELKAQIKSCLEYEREKINEIVREGARAATDKKLCKQRIDMLAEVVQYLEIQEAISLAHKLSLDSDYVVCAYIVAGEKKEKRILVGTLHDTQEEEIRRGSPMAVHIFAEFRNGRNRWSEDKDQQDTESDGDGEINEAIPY